MKVGVIGTGYVGLVTGTCLSDMGNDVTCHDIDLKKIEGLKKGVLPIYEPGLQDVLERNYREGRLHFTVDMEVVTQGAEVCFIAVGTPPDEDGSADRSYVLAAARAIAEYAKGPLIAVVKSTVPVGTCDRVQRQIDQVLADRGVDFEIAVCSNPEFLKEGKAVPDFMRPDRVVVGVKNESSKAVMQRLYEPFMRNGHPLLLMDIRSAEMTKYASNVMLATRISLMNELAQVCTKVGADIMEVRRGMGTDQRIGMHFLYAGVGYGGSCFPKDVQALSRLAMEEGCPADILEAVEKVNRYQKMWLPNQILEYFDGNVRGKRIGLWGLAFKPHTDDMRLAPSLTLIKRLAEAGATIIAYDPEATPNAKEVLKKVPQVEFADDPYEAVKGTDALALVTEWGVFRSLDFERVKALMKAPVLFDGRNQFEPKRMAELGFRYTCVGRPQC